MVFMAFMNKSSFDSAFTHHTQLELLVKIRVETCCLTVLGREWMSMDLHLGVLEDPRNI